LQFLLIEPPLFHLSTTKEVETISYTLENLGKIELVHPKEGLEIEKKKRREGMREDLWVRDGEDLRRFTSIREDPHRFAKAREGS
jgi:hypothetical protein